MKDNITVYDYCNQIKMQNNLFTYWLKIIKDLQLKLSLKKVNLR